MNWIKLVFSKIWLIGNTKTYKFFDKKSKGSGIKSMPNQ